MLETPPAPLWPGSEATQTLHFVNSVVDTSLTSITVYIMVMLGEKSKRGQNHKDLSGVINVCTKFCASLCPQEVNI